MTLNPNKFAIATAASFAILWILCSLIVMALPHQSMNVSGYMMHSDMSAWQWDMGIAGLFMGLVAWSVVGGVTAWLIATIYNRLL